MNDKGFDEIRETLSREEPLKKFTIIDCHAHLGQWFNFHIPEFDEKSLIKSMDVLGIDKMGISALLSIGPDFVYGNEWVHRAVKQYPDRFFGYIGISVNTPDAGKRNQRYFEEYYNVLKKL
jgi:predicted TIM-barrel fold metal-dependent hydrolase